MFNCARDKLTFNASDKEVAPKLKLQLSVVFVKTTTKDLIKS